MRFRGFAALVIGVALTASGCNMISNRMTMNEANEQYTAQNYEKAIQLYAKVLANSPDDWQANYLTAVSYLALYKPGSQHPKDKEYADKGIAKFEELMKLNAPSPELAEKVKNYYLTFLDSAGRQDQAIEFLEAELAKKPDDVNLIGRIANMYQKKGDFESWLKYLERRTELEPNNKEAWYSVGVACWNRSYHGGVLISQEEREQIVEKGIAALDKALAIDPKYFDALSYINLMYREKMKVLTAFGKNQEAGEAYMKAEEYKEKAIKVRDEQKAAAKGKEA